MLYPAKPVSTMWDTPPLDADLHTTGCRWAEGSGSEADGGLTLLGESSGHCISGSTYPDVYDHGCGRNIGSNGEQLLKVLEFPWWWENSHCPDKQLPAAREPWPRVWTPLHAGGPGRRAVRLWKSQVSHLASRFITGVLTWSDYHLLQCRHLGFRHKIQSVRWCSELGAARGMMGTCPGMPTSSWHVQPSKLWACQTAQSDHDPRMTQYSPQKLVPAATGLSSHPWTLTSQITEVT